VPAPNSVLSPWRREHSLGLRDDGSIVAWGKNAFGQTTVPAPISGFVAVAAGSEYSLGLKAAVTRLQPAGGGAPKTSEPRPCTET
jgi:hypothetical protein